MRVHEMATYGAFMPSMLLYPRPELLVGIPVIVHIVTR